MHINQYLGIFIIFQYNNFNKYNNCFAIMSGKLLNFLN